MKRVIVPTLFLVGSTLSAQSPRDSVLAYETTTTTRAGLGVFGNVVMKVRTTESADGIREELIDRTGVAAAHGPFLNRPGTYTLKLKSGEMLAVDPSAREYFAISAADFKDSTIEQMEHFADNIHTMAHSDVDSLGDGDIVAGYPATHWRTHEVMQVTTAANGDSVTMITDLVIDAYYSVAMRHLAPDVWVENYDTHSSRKLPTTVELKSIKKGAMSFSGVAMPIEISREITTIEKRPADKSLFAVPAGYKKIEMPFPKASEFTSH